MAQLLVIFKKKFKSIGPKVFFSFSKMARCDTGFVDIDETGNQAFRKYYWYSKFVANWIQKWEDGNKEVTEMDA